MTAQHVKDCIGEDLTSTAEWRRLKAEEYPDDERNLEAAERLERLSEELDQVSNEHPSFSSIAKAWEDDGACSSYFERKNDLFRAIGFNSHIDSAKELLDELENMTSM